MIFFVPLQLSKAESSFESPSKLPYIPYDYIVSSDYSITNNDWNGASKIHELTKEMGYPIAIVESFSKPLSGRYKNSILVILYPDFGINPQELYDYVANGGNVLIADDFGYGNYVLRQFQVSFGAGEVYDDENNYDGKNYAPIVNFGKAFPGETISNVVTNHPAYFISNRQELAYFSETSYADNFIGMKDPDETDTPLVFAGALNVGKGRIIILSDPSVFINDMLEIGDNKALYQSSISWLSGGSKAYTVFFEKRLDKIPKMKISNAEKRLNESETNFNEAQKQCNAGDYEKCMDLTAKGRDGIDTVLDALFGKGSKERAKSEIESSLKEIIALEKEINDSKKSGKNTIEAEQYLNNAKDKLKAGISGYSMGEYSNALKLSQEGEDSISKARDALYDKNRLLGAKIELARSESSLTRLKKEIGYTENDDVGIKKGNKLLISIRSLLNPLFVLQTWLLLLMGLIALFLGEKYVPIVSAFFKKINMVSGYQHSMQKVMSSDRYNEPAKILIQEFKGTFYKKIGAEYNMPKKEVMDMAFARYPFLNKRRLNKTLKTLEKIQRESGRFSAKDFEKLYSDVHAILNEIKEAETIENRKIR